MGTRTDAALAAVALAAFIALAALVDASLSPLYLVVGGTGTVAFELIAARDVELVRRYWERRSVQLASLAAAVALAAVGALVAPTPVLSLCCGAAGTYLALLALLGCGIVPPLRTWWK